jgi:hypothetical protein
MLLIILIDAKIRGNKGCGMSGTALAVFGGPLYNNNDRSRDIMPTIISSIFVMLVPTNSVSLKVVISESIGGIFSTA